MRKIIYMIVGLLLCATSVFAVSGYPTKAVVINKPLTNANTEYVIGLPQGVSGMSIQSRTAADFKMAFVEGDSGAVYFTVKSGTVYQTPTPLGLVGATKNTTIFLQSGSAGQIIELLYWQ